MILILVVTCFLFKILKSRKFTRNGRTLQSLQNFEPIGRGNNKKMKMAS